MKIHFHKEYFMGEPIAQTPYCNIYKARELNSLRDVCIKEIDLSMAPDRQLQRQLLNSVQKEVHALTVAGDQIARIPCIFDHYHDAAANRFYIIMQWIDGQSLKEHMHDTPNVFLRHILNLANILQQLHKLNINHKDIKPENVMIQDGDVRLIDFNISLSVPNLVEGTYRYAAPEMYLPTQNVSRDYCDVFALGVILYEYFTGVIPTLGIHYTEDSGPQWHSFKSAKETALAVGKSAVHDDMDRIITKCMQKDFSQRYRTMRAFIQDLRAAMRSYNGK